MDRSEAGGGRNRLLPGPEGARPCQHLDFRLSVLGEHKFLLLSVPCLLLVICYEHQETSVFTYPAFQSWTTDYSFACFLGWERLGRPPRRRSCLAGAALIGTGVWTTWSGWW